ncbi:MAG: hypothetical protein HYZ52_03280 [Candidatus Omnitrophica bacterium]|nr:hypothetical protein [Candidatus Omnitrophota bacterium]
MTAGFCLLALLLCPSRVCAADKTPLYALDTDENDVDEGLNRISGQVDTGFTRPEQTSKSNHYHAGDPDRRKPASPPDNQ